MILEHWLYTLNPESEKLPDVLFMVAVSLERQKAELEKRGVVLKDGCTGT